MRDRAFDVIRAGVESRAERGCAEIQFEQLLARPLDVIGATRDACRVAAELLPERHRHRVLQMRAARLQHVRERTRLVVERGAQFAGGGEEAGGRGEEREPRGGGEHVVGRLSHVDVIVGMNLVCTRRARRRAVRPRGSRALRSCSCCATCPRPPDTRPRRTDRDARRQEFRRPPRRSRRLSSDRAARDPRSRAPPPA